MSHMTVPVMRELSIAPALVAWNKLRLLPEGLQYGQNIAWTARSPFWRLRKNAVKYDSIWPTYRGGQVQRFHCILHTNSLTRSYPTQYEHGMYNLIYEFSYQLPCRVLVICKRITVSWLTCELVTDYNKLPYTYSYHTTTVPTSMKVRIFWGIYCHILQPLKSHCLQVTLKPNFRSRTNSYI
jgi:hypothetical protein